MLSPRTSIVTTAGLVPLAAALALSLHAATGALLPFDRAVVDEFQHVPGGEVYEWFANVLALAVVEYAVLFGAAGYAWYRGDRLLAVSVLLVLAARTLNNPIKDAIDRPRPGPDAVIIRDPGENSGFPSGHASTVVLVYGYAAFVAIKHGPRSVGIAATVFAVTVALLIGWDRVYDGAHWPSDVLGGYAIGATLLIVAVTAPAAAMRLWHRLRHSAVGHSEMRGLG
jgi:undecaprenyl-diphosphatase